MSIAAIQKYPWPENLLRMIFPGDLYEDWMYRNPPDVEASLRYILEETLTDRETCILHAYFRDHVRIQTISEQYGIREERCRKIIHYAIQRIRQPSRMKYLRLGLAEAARLRKDPLREEPGTRYDISNLNLGIKTFDCLRGAGIRTVEELSHFSRSQLMQIKYMGAYTVAEVEKKLKERGLSLRQEDT